MNEADYKQAIGKIAAIYFSGDEAEIAKQIDSLAADSNREYKQVAHDVILAAKQSQ